MVTLLRWSILVVGLVVVGGTLLSCSRHPHWFIRGWDFPRVHIATLAAVSGGSYAAFFCDWWWYEWLFMLTLVCCVVWQGYKIFPYTQLAPVQVKRARAPAGAASFRLLIANVLMQNHQFDRFLQVVQATDPDLILAVEINDRWLAELQSLERLYPYVVHQPQDNMYGIVLWSRLKLIEPQVRFLIQDDIPSIHTGVELRSGTRIFFYGLHPRPPEPLRDQDATPRDAELVFVGREISKYERPTLVAGDLNDVAWSHTTNLFLRLSHLVDPRLGRGFYNTFNANTPWFRYPLDHVFHSNCFTLIDLRRLEHIGSDHFPMCITLHYEPAAAAEQPSLADKPGQEEEAQEKLDLATSDPSVRAGGDTPQERDTC
jgi:endonuclease/exonuclease/phosphatase (EEP) superfamily protein YafD